jgi:tetratricopeptide (TPR) repeat protein
MGDLYEESGDISRSSECIRRFLESDPLPEEARSGWEKLATYYQRLGDSVGAGDAYIQAFTIPGASLSAISNAANWLNNQRASLFEPVARDRIFRGFVGLMERKIRESSANDLSRLAWLHLHIGDSHRARTLAEQGLAKEPGNLHCARLVERLRDEP